MFKYLCKYPTLKEHSNLLKDGTICKKQFRFFTFIIIIFYFPFAFEKGVPNILITSKKTE